MKNQLSLLLFLLVSASGLAQTAPTSFTVDRSTSADFSSPVSTTTTSTSLSVTGLTPGTTYYVRVRGSNGTVATTSAYSSASVTTTSSGTASSGTSLTFTNSEVGQPITLFSGPPRYYQGTAGVDWGSGSNAGPATTKLPAGGDGWISFQYTGTTQAAMGFDSLGTLASPGGYGSMRVGVFIYNANIGVVRNGVLVDITPTMTAAVGSYLRVRRAITGGVASYFVEYSATGATWTDITPAPTAPATKYFTLSTTGNLYPRLAINSNYILVAPTSSTNFTP